MKVLSFSRKTYLLFNKNIQLFSIFMGVVLRDLFSVTYFLKQVNFNKILYIKECVTKRKIETNSKVI